MIDCDECDGTGISLESETIVCTNCGGHGEVSPYRDFYEGVEGLEDYYK